MFAIDSGGAPVQGVPVTVAILPVAYGKGILTCAAGAQYWAPAYSTLGTDPHAYRGLKLCTNEDTDYTGNIASQDPVPAPSNCTDLTNNASIAGHLKDYNCNGKLDPGNVAVVSPSSGNTDANGRLDVKITYPRDHANWVEVSLIASTIVQGTQSSTTSTFVLQGALSDYLCTIGPPGAVSPYGIAATCADPR